MWVVGINMSPFTLLSTKNTLDPCHTTGMQLESVPPTYHTSGNERGGHMTWQGTTRGNMLVIHEKLSQVSQGPTEIHALHAYLPTMPANDQGDFRA